MATRDLLIIVAAVLLLRLPFLNQAVQGDESTFLAAAEHALVDPLHPNHVHYIFTPAKVDVDLRGGSHLPMDAWALAGLIAIFGGVKEVPFHAAYMVFSLLAALSMYSLARRFSPQPLWATLLFLAVPAFVVNGGSFEADVPHVAFFLCGVACFIRAVDQQGRRLSPDHDGGRRLSPGSPAGQRPTPRGDEPTLQKQRFPGLLRSRQTTKNDGLPHGGLDAADSSGARWLGASALFLACAGLTVMQAQMAAPILLVYVWMYARNWLPGWIGAFSPCVALWGWEVFERVTSGEFPFRMTARYVDQQGWHTIGKMFLGAAGLSMHLWFIVFPLLFAAGVWAAWRRRDRDTAFLALWIGIYLAAACAVFFSGSARYLLPIAAPVAIWASFARRSWVIGGFALQMALSLCLAIENYQHWGAYREFVQEVVRQAGGRRMWVNSEYGLRHYMEDAGARVAGIDQLIPAGDVVVWSELVSRVPVQHTGSLVVPMLQKEVRPWMPVRIIGMESYAGFSDITRGFAPFGIGMDLVDRIHADVYKEAKPTLQDLPMNAPEAEAQIVSGIFDLEQGMWRWMSGTAAVMLVSPAVAEPLHVNFSVPGNATARRLSVTLDGQTVYSESLPGEGIHRIVTAPVKAKGATSMVGLEVDRTFSAPGDSRVLGIVLYDVGWGK